MSRIFPAIEAGRGLSDKDAETIVRWLWKFEGLAWAYSKLDEPQWHYSDRWTLLQRVLETPLGELRSHLVVAIGLANQNGDGFSDWPMGLDTPISETDGIFMSGVFRRIAVMVSLDEFAELIPAGFAQYALNPEASAENIQVFFPPTTFPTCTDAVQVTTRASTAMKAAHEQYARNQNENRLIAVARNRLIIPN